MSYHLRSASLLTCSEYDDDTTIIPRATVVTARRLPAAKQGAGKAARYVTGKMPGHAKNSFKKDQAAKDKAEKASASIQEAGTEQEKMQAMFQVLSGAWSAEREDLSQYVYSLTCVPIIWQMGIFKTDTNMCTARNPFSSTSRDPTGRPTSRIMTPRMVTSAIAVAKRATGSKCARQMTILNTTTGAA